MAVSSDADDDYAAGWTAEEEEMISAQEEEAASRGWGWRPREQAAGLGLGATAAPGPDPNCLRFPKRRRMCPPVRVAHTCSGRVAPCTAHDGTDSTHAGARQPHRGAAGHRRRPLFVWWSSRRCPLTSCCAQAREAP